MQIILDLPPAMVEALRQIVCEHEDATGEKILLKSAAKLMLAQALVDHGYIDSMAEALNINAKS